LDKPMQGHGLMQAIARVNRVFKDKPGGLIVDYLGLADQLRQALAVYTEGDRQQAGIPQEQAVELLRQQVEIVQGMYFGFDYRRIFTVPSAGRMAVLGQAVDHILGLDDGQRRYADAVATLSKAFALAVPHEAALAVQDEVGFFQAVRAVLAKGAAAGGTSKEDLDHAIRQIVSGAVTSDQVIDLFSAAGLKTPDISILSDEFLAEVRRSPQKNLALELLQRLLNAELATRTRTNVVQSRLFSAMLERALRQYQNRSIETAQVIAELIELAKELRAARSRGEELGLSEEELAFYDALETNDSAVKVLGDTTLRAIARELAEIIRRNTSIDWTLKESARARLRLLVKRLLRQYGYPPDKQDQATKAVLEQAEALAREWAA
ncbi:MAG: type I restriction enzyme endonuclease domain-containing protein, partial [Chloroflexota bacterium]